jgi:hypothetical protein
MAGTKMGTETGFLDLDGTAVLVPAASAQISAWVNPAAGQVVTQTDASSIGQGNRTGQRDDLIDWAYHASFADPEVGTLDGKMTAFLVPQG